MDAPCSACTPTSQPFCGFCGNGPYGPRPASFFIPKGPTTGDELVAEFDRMADIRRTKMREARAASTPLETPPRASSTRPQCAENVGTGVKIHQCTFTAIGETLYCGRHQKTIDASPSWDAEPAGLVDVPDALPFN